MSWLVERNGADVEAWIKQRLKVERDPRMRGVLRWGLHVVQRARSDPLWFADEVEQNYDKVLALYRAYREGA